MAWIASGVVAASGLMALLPLVLDERGRAVVYASEYSIVEEASICLWVVLAVILPVLFRPVTLKVLAAVVASLACAAREADLHKAFTDYSVLKVGYYVRGAFPLEDRAFAGLLVGLGVLCVVVTVLAGTRRALADGGLRAQWVRVVLLVLALAGLSKVFDRSPELLEDYGIDLPVLVREVVWSVEEGLELLLPPLLLVAVILCGDGARAAGVGGRLVEGSGSGAGVPRGQGRSGAGAKFGPAGAQPGFTGSASAPVRVSG